jgi:hypothetical protein
MSQRPEPLPIPAHTPIVLCPTCGRHTDHSMSMPGQYLCLRCKTVHQLAPLRKVHQQDDLVW